jgi:hypothetical protein
LTPFRVTSRANPSDRFEDDFDDVIVSDGMWVFTRNRSAPDDGAGQTFGSWSVDGHTVEIEEHGGAWRQLDPEAR